MNSTIHHPLSGFSSASNSSYCSGHCNYNICQKIEQYDKNGVYLCDPIRNNIINDGNFIRILYSNSLFTLNGIYILFPLNVLSIEKYYNKLKCNFNISQHKSLIEQIRMIEYDILKKVCKNKIPHYKIFDQLKNGNIKIFNDEVSFWNEDPVKNNNSMTPPSSNELHTNTSHPVPSGFDGGSKNHAKTINESLEFILKISGIWESEMNYGITFKFIKVNQFL